MPGPVFKSSKEVHFFLLMQPIPIFAMIVEVCALLWMRFFMSLQVESLLATLQFSIMKVPVKGGSGNSSEGRSL